jgi:hypothetical protein
LSLPIPLKGPKTLGSRDSWELKDLWQTGNPWGLKTLEGLNKLWKLKDL